ncbi:gamma-glutamyltransferase [Pseudomonas putida]|uniref:gamma-glutamyltransferase n=1 Tax=Pseudomonas putida TaxID=303 RepID=UPI0035715CEA
MRNFEQPGRSEAMSTRTMVATSHGLATSAALEILRQGGNAVDAAITAAAMLAVVEPTQTGIGGDCFALLKKNGEPVKALNGSGWAPKAATVAHYRGKKITEIDPYSADAVTVPGAVAAWERLSRDHGRLPFSKLLEPAIQAAEFGYPVTERLAYDWHRNAWKRNRCANFAEVFFPNGVAPACGAIHRQPLLAKTLKSIAQDGAAVFYKGWVAEDLLSSLQSRGGLHSAEDFSEYQPEYVDPISASYRDYDIWECPPSGQGIIALAMLKILEQFNLGDLAPLGAERLHLQAEASRMAYAERDLFLCDPQFASCPVEHLLSNERAQALASRIKLDRRMTDITPLPHAAHNDTVYISVVDEEGFAVSLINSIFDDFGSGVLTSQSGVLLHNRGSSFVIDESHHNRIEGRKRPMHTIIPAMVTREGEMVLSFGVTGAHFQPIGQVQVLTNLIDYGMGVQEAIDHPRMFARENTFELEGRYPEQTLQKLRMLGHDARRAAAPLGTAQAIWVEGNGVRRGGADPRRDGVALGF